MLIEELKSTLNISLPKKINNFYKAYKSSIGPKIKEAEQKTQTLNQSLLQIEKSTINKKLSDAKKLIAFNEEKNIQQVKSYELEISNLVDKTKQTKQNVETLILENHKKESEINVTKRKNDLAAAKYNLLYTSKKNEINKQEELKNDIALLTKKNGKPKSSANDKESFANEKRLSNLISQVTSLHEEIMKKDTQIIKRTRELLKTEEEIISVERFIKNVEQKMTETKEDIYNRFSEELTKKNKDIEMLKEILRGNASEIKAKEITVNEFRRKLDNSMPSSRLKVKERNSSSKLL